MQKNKKDENTIRKLDGRFEEYSPHKLRQSLLNSGAPIDIANDIVQEITDDDTPDTTKELHKLVYDKLLYFNQEHIAARYSLKKALHSLGPTGYPFEKYISSIYKFMGYETETNVILQGDCVEHEMDVIARTDSDLIYIECKYHQSQSAKSNVKVPLYVKSRTVDLYDYQVNVEKPGTKFSFFVATNTRFTTDAVQYARCKGIKLLSWEHPVGESLPKIIDRYGLHPITVLTCITRKQAVNLINLGIVQIHDVPKNRKKIQHSGINAETTEKMINEALAILDLNRK